MSEIRNGSGKTLYIVMIIALLALNAWLFYNAQQNKKEKIQYESELAEVDSLHSALEVNYYKLKVELDKRKGENASKDSVIFLLESELNEKRKEISVLLSGNGFSAQPNGSKQLQEAKERIAKLESELAFYLAKINEYTDQYNVLLDQYDELQNMYDEQVARNSLLQKDRDSILTIGSIIMAADIMVLPVQEKKSGEKETGNAKKTDKLKINFDLVPNMLSAGRNQTFYMKLVDPNNVLMQSSDSGINEYSAMIQVDYGGQKKETHTVYWDQNYAFLPGEYKVEMMHNGHTIGEETFLLK